MIIPGHLLSCILEKEKEKEKQQRIYLARAVEISFINPTKSTFS